MSRFPQILINYRNKNTNGISVATFALLFSADVFYDASILMAGTSLWVQLPWFLAPIVAAFADATVMIQVYIYRHNAVRDVEAR